MIVIFMGAIGLMLVAPLFLRRNAASPMLAGGSLMLVVLAVAGLLHVDSRMGQAAIDSNRRFYLYFLGCSIPVLILALVSWRRFKWAFWVGWGIGVAFCLSILVVVVWLEFFWHW